MMLLSDSSFKGMVIITMTNYKLYNYIFEILIRLLFNIFGIILLHVTTLLFCSQHTYMYIDDISLQIMQAINWYLFKKTNTNISTTKYHNDSEFINPNSVGQF